MANEYQQSVNLRGGGNGAQGTPGSTPFIGPNGNWWIDNVDQGINASFSASDIMVPGRQNELLKYDASSDKLIPSGAFSPSDGELMASTNSVYLGAAHSLTSAGRTVALRNLFSGQSFAPISSQIDPVTNNGPTWRKYTDMALTEVTLEPVSTDVLTDPMFLTGAPLDRRTFSAEIIPAEPQADLWFEVLVGSVQVWRANLGPVLGGSPLRFDLGDYSSPYDLRATDTVYVRIRGKVKGNSSTGRAYLKAWYRTWTEVRLLDTDDRAILQQADNSESTARAEGDQAQQVYTDGKVAAEATLRQSGDATTLASAKSYADSQTASEAAARNAAIAVAIGQEITARNAAISTAIGTEITNRNSAIAGAISQEVTDRNAAVSAALGTANGYTDTKVTAEATARTNGDATTLASAKAYADSLATVPGSPVPRTLVFGTPVQASAPTKPAWVSAVVEANYTVTLAGTQADTVELRIGPTAADVTNATAASVVVASWRASVTGIALVVGMAIADRGQLSANLPIGWYFALRRIAGTTATIVSAVDQSMRA